MGAAASVELNKPADVSDITVTNDIEVAKAELIRLRTLLGHLASQYGFATVVLDASDVVKGEVVEEDFERCIAEIRHIRACLRLGTAKATRKTRALNIFSFGQTSDMVGGGDPKEEYYDTDDTSSSDEEGEKKSGDEDEDEKKDDTTDHPSLKLSEEDAVSGTATLENED